METVYNAVESLANFQAGSSTMEGGGTMAAIRRRTAIILRRAADDIKKMCKENESELRRCQHATEWLNQ